MAISTVSEYIGGLNENGKQYVGEFVKYMEEEYPNLTLKISFSMPMWLVGKKMNEGYIAISASKNHFSIHFSDEEYIGKMMTELTKCKNGKRCINIKYGDDKSFEIVKKGVKKFLDTI